MTDRISRYGHGCASTALVAFLIAAPALAHDVPQNDTTAPVASSADDAAETARRFAALRNDPARLRLFLQAFPKGADLHNHLAGAIYAEPMLDWARTDRECLDPRRQTLSNDSSCGRPGLVPAAEAFNSEDTTNRAIDAMSMRGFVPTETDRSGHDHFFDTFDKFDAAYETHQGEALAEVLAQAARDHELYLETMVSPALAQAMALGAHHPLKGNNFAGSYAEIAPSLPAVVATARAEINQMESRAHAILGCGTAHPQPGCAVTVRYLFQPLRILPPPMVFGQLAAGYALAHSDPRVVGVNFVAPEDDPVALRDYDLHMRMFRYLNGVAPDVKLSLHAGELTLGLVPPSELESHIRQAVEVAGARRIGHGVDIAYERDAAELLHEMAQKQIMVEINLSSNAQILGVSGGDHPFMLYRRAGVPTALSTDDEGVSRIDLTHEYQRATTTYGLDYPTLKQLSATGIRYGFESDADRTTLNARLQHDFAAFEHWAAHEPLFR
ncbi:adenosine deaminase family protein [Tanticharoenia sakaeratensis]|uniref:adenosine deaminase n=1 Tax=Tanticharoenia sakaeratensis NBRC 103193 TaxID=1231623 RepID=A0A0D6MJI1_9PROT|nr:hypothetical protein [Tanticharoenia sakaeratensis]GAN53646.1 adenosine/AMP deaminase [Tanticharoenia sakaeratensis NBRC 103193]